MDLIVDIGNTYTKAAVFSGDDLVAHKAFKITDTETLISFVDEYPVKHGIISSVSLVKEAILSTLKEKLEFILFADHTTPIPIENLYSSRETLGFDRLASAVGANAIYPAENILIIDAGTAITIDLVDKKGRFHGGNISPGLDMRLKALNESTKNLPLVSKEGKVDLIAKNTQDAIRSGVFNSIIFEMDGYINAVNQIFKNLKVILTGGDHIYFVKKLKNSIFVDSNLTLKGLNRILQYNAI